MTIRFLLTRYTSMLSLFMLITVVNASKNLRDVNPSPTNPVHAANRLANEDVGAQKFTDSAMRPLSEFLTPSERMILSATNAVIHQHTSKKVKDEAGYLLMKVVEKFGGNTTELDRMKEVTKQTQNESLWKWYDRVKRIFRMFFESSVRFNVETTTLTRNENETCAKWLSRVEVKHRKLLEKEALTVLYDNTNGDGWRRKTNWKTDANICEWEGVTCTNGSVTTLDFSGNKLSGKIPKEIGQLSQLTHLYLSDNNLSGEIPNEIGQLSSLKTLELQNNELSGPIPKEICRLTNLHFLSLYENKLSGPIPTEIGQLINVKKLHLSDNNLSGSIPKEIGQLSNLRGLYLYKNNLSGSIPNEIGQLSQLTHLYLEYNELTGSIPKEIGQLSNLERLWLSDNKLSGSIPNEIGLLTNLVTLGLNKNDLSGAIPKEFGQLTNLEALNLHKNNLSGTIPKEIGHLTKLKELWLSDNKLTGSIPSEIGQPKFLAMCEELHLYPNQLTGDSSFKLFLFGFSF